MKTAVTSTSDNRSLDLRANLVLPVNLQCSALYSTNIKFVNLIGRIISETNSYGFLENFLKRLQIETCYLKDKDGKKRTQLLKIKSLAHMRKPELDQEGGQKIQNGRLVWKDKAEVVPGNADHLMFECDKEMISVKA